MVCVVGIRVGDDRDPADYLPNNRGGRREMKMISGCLTRAIMVAALSMAGSAFIAVPIVAAAEMESTIARGGKIYDKWYKMAKTEAPKASHALYPSDKKYAKKPGANWRCKECHGWDYRGTDGAYKSGKHATGIKGINGAAGKPVADIVAMLSGSKHGYGDKMDTSKNRHFLTMAA